MTLTPRFPDCTPRKITREFVNRFIRNVAWAAQGPVPWLYVIERSQAGVYHIHALLAGTRALSIEQVRHSWKLGVSQVARYSQLGGAPWYLAKTLGQSDEHWEHFDLSRRMPPRLPGPVEETRGVYGPDGGTRG